MRRVPAVPHTVPVARRLGAARDFHLRAGPRRSNQAEPADSWGRIRVLPLEVQAATIRLRSGVEALAQLAAFQAWAERLQLAGLRPLAARPAPGGQRLLEARRAR